MNIYIIVINGVVSGTAHTTKKAAILSAGLPYNNSTRKEWIFYKESIEYEIKIITLKKVSGRGRSFA